MLKQNSIVELNVHALGVNGEGVAKHNGFTVFVDDALPNETVLAKIDAVKPNYAKGHLLSILRPDNARIDPQCSRFKECGGCQIMHLSYDAQVLRKTQLVKDALKHIGGIDDALVLPCFPSQPFYYRNKIQLPVAKMNDVIVTGFYRRGSHEVVPYEQCLVHHQSMEDTVHNIRDLLQASDLTPYEESSTRGTLRHVIIRTNSKGEHLIGLVTTGKQKTEVKNFAKKLTEVLKNVVGVVESINTKAQNVILGDKHIALIGQPSLFEEIDGLQFKISLPSFFQVNLDGAKVLYKTALEFAQIDKNSVVLDAYCGIGTMSLMAAKIAKQVVGAECVKEAVQDAKVNAQLNNIKNAQFVVAKIEENQELFKNIDVALINPPRKGLDQKVVSALNDYGPERLVYVSCNPATLARDIRGLSSYQLLKIQPVDMFPQTMHVESVALLVRK